jgi:ABC-type branched-subunit amino acid transport system substrate-binding protein
MAASAVRTALKVGAGLIVVLSHTSTAARLVRQGAAGEGGQRFAMGGGLGVQQAPWQASQ